jgi:hypothetical protein
MASAREARGGERSTRTCSATETPAERLFMNVVLLRVL